MERPVVETTHGKVMGVGLDGVSIFRGLRYGAPTGGGNRFRPPVPPQPWPGIQDASSYGPSAIQAPTAESNDPLTAWYFAVEPGSEDCLFLNVFTPGADGAKRPVMVWLHGGAWAWCAGTAPGFDGSPLACHQDVVVVTLNHRLDLFGFLYLGKQDERFRDSGNAGILDIALALEWVKMNIGRFGGDPDNVTIFGESGGGSKVAALLALPSASGLFHKAVIQSTGGGMRLAEIEEAERHTSDVLALLDIDRQHLSLLQAVPVNTLLDVMSRNPRPFRAVRDGQLFDCHPFGDRASGHSKNIPLMVGATANEASFYLRHNPENWMIDRSRASGRVSRFLKVEPTDAESLLDHYEQCYPGLEAPELLCAIGSDFMFKRNALAIAQMHSEQSASPVFAYQFEWSTAICGGRYGSPHTCEVPFIFGTTQSATALLGKTAGIAPMTQVMMASWAAFARHGSPDNSLLPRWRPYDAGGRNVMRLNVESELACDPGGDGRAAMAHLPYFGYGHSIPAFVYD